MEAAAGKEEVDPLSKKPEPPTLNKEDAKVFGNLRQMKMISEMMVEVCLDVFRHVPRHVDEDDQRQ